MITRHALIVSAAAVLIAMGVDAASSQTSQAGLRARTPTIKFLEPLRARFLVTPSESDVCRALQGRRCPPVLIYGGSAGSVLPTIEPVIKLYLPNVRVSFVLQEIANEAVANGGVDGDPETFVEWLTTSSAATMENGGPYGYPLPPPGVTWDGDDLYHTVIYDALVVNACESFSPFPVEHDASIDDNGAEIGAFHGEDGSTLDHTGYYNFNYTARGTAADGGVSDFHFSGKVNVICSGLNSLP